MREIDEPLRAHLDGGATTLCHCWKLTLASGEVLGFTDHDRDLTVAGVGYEADAGFTASEIESALGFSVDNLDAAGALRSGLLDGDRLAAGDFDNAAIEVWRVNWQDPEQRLLLRAGNLGEVRHGGVGFVAEVRGLAHRLDQPQGRIYQFGCDAALGDARCGVDTDLPAFRGDGAVLAIEDDRRLTASGLSGFGNGWFERGSLAWTSGANSGRRHEIKFHRLAETGAVTIELWRKTARPVAPGDAFIVRAGCDKQFSTCRAKFANGANFRGFPHIPGDDFVLSYANRGDPGNDGRSRNQN